MLTINRAKQLIKFIEELLNPDHDYEKEHKGYENDPNFYKLDSDYARPVHKILKNEADKRLDPEDMTSPHAKALINYSGADYLHMNHILRHGTVHSLHKPENNDKSKESYEEQTTHLKSLTKNPTQHEFYGYRGVSGDSNLTNVKHGEIIHDKGFASVSLRPKIASAFANTSAEGKEGNRFRVHITPGTKGHYISAHSEVGGNHPREAEFVLHPNTKFRVGDSHVDLRGKRFTDLHIHSQEE